MPWSINSCTRISRWNPISSLTSRRGSGRLSLRRKVRFMGTLGRREREGARDGARVGRPARGLSAQMRAASGGERVVLGLASRLGLSPLLGDDAASLEAVECGVERTFLNAEHVLGGLADPSADGIAVSRTPGECFQDQDVECACEKIGAGHGMLCD